MSVGGDPGQGCDGVGDEGKICDCLSCSIEEIARATEDIARILDEKLGKVCDNVDECIDEIIQAINEKFGPGLSTVSECKRLLEIGLGGTLEYAIRCAGVAAEDACVVCSLGDPTTEGKCCILPDGTEGICKNGVCVPVEKEEEKEAKFIGWCNPTTKVVVVTKQGEPSPGSNFVQVRLAETEQVAFLEAESFCKAIELTQPPGPLIEIPPVPSFAAFTCKIDDYNNNAVNNQISQFAPGTGAWQAFALIHEQTLQLGMAGIDINLVSNVLFGTARMAGLRDALVPEKYVNVLGQILNCTDRTFLESAKALSAIGSVQKLTGTDFSEMALTYRYAMNLSCRQRMLDPDKAIAAYLANSIDGKQLDTYWGIHGLCNPPLNEYLRAARAKPVPLQLAIMRHREIIGTSEYHSKMRELGYLEPEVAEQLFDITRQVPTLQDIIRFMVRDADDTEGVVATFRLDDLFDEKFPKGGKLRKWAEDQGIPEDIARYAWRSHWTIPAPSQLFEFFKRLRNDRRFPNMTQDIKDALVQQDILPFWHDAFFAVSFRPMRLRDIRRSFQIGTLTEAEARFQFSQLGYSDATVDLMFRFLERLRDRSIVGHKAIKLWLDLVIDRAETVNRLDADGFPGGLISSTLTDASIGFVNSDFARAFLRGDMTRAELDARLAGQGLLLPEITKILSLLSFQIKTHWALSEYKVGTMDEPGTRAQMNLDGMAPEVINATVDEVTRDVRLGFVRSCQNGIKRKFLLGELDVAQSIAELVLRQTVNARAALMVDWWGCELKAGERNVSAVTLCEWLERGAITSVDFTKRLEKIGFSPADAALMMEDCLIKISARRLTQAKKEAKEQAAEQARVDRILKRAALEEQRQLNKLRSMREKAARTRDRRLKQLHKAIDKATDRGGLSTNEAYLLLNSEKGRIESQFALSQDQALQTLLLATEEWGGQSTQALVSLIDEIAARVVAADVSGETGEIAVQQSNGQS